MPQDSAAAATTPAGQIGGPLMVVSSGRSVRRLRVVLAPSAIVTLAETIWSFIEVGSGLQGIPGETGDGRHGLRYG